MITSLISDYNWVPWKFSVVPKNFWKDKNNQRKFLEYYAKENNIENQEDWYKVIDKDVCLTFPGNFHFYLYFFYNLIYIFMIFLRIFQQTFFQKKICSDFHFLNFIINFNFIFGIFFEFS